MVSVGERNRSETRRNAGLAIKYKFEDEWLDSLDEPMGGLVDGGAGSGGSGGTRCSQPVDEGEKDMAERMEMVY